MSLGISLLISAGCRRDVVWNQTRSISPSGWPAEEVVEFNLDPTAYEPKSDNRFAEMTAKATGDTARRYLGNYSATLAVRHLERCNVAVLRLVYEKSGLAEPMISDTISIPLFHADGRPVGNGRLAIYESRIVIRDFRVNDGTIFSLHPVEYSDSICGITDITLLLTPR